MREVSMRFRKKASKKLKKKIKFSKSKKPRKPRKFAPITRSIRQALRKTGESKS